MSSCSGPNGEPFADQRQLRDRFKGIESQLALARPIAEACAAYIERTCKCPLCMYDSTVDPVWPHDDDCPVPAWIAGRK